MLSGINDKSYSNKQKQQLCAFVTLLQAMGCDVIAFDGNAFKVKKNEDKH